MSGKPLVSGIIIFLDGERFIEEAIESVFVQTYDNWELLLVDDGSTDGSTEIAKSYARTYPEKVRYLEHPGHQNRGMSASRNLGVKHARGEYVALLDADDVWMEQKLERQVEILNSHPEAAMLYGRTRLWFSWTGNPEDFRRDRMTELSIEPDTLVEPPALLALSLRDEETVPSTCSVLIRREVFEDLGGLEEAFRDMYEDMTFYAKVSFKAPVFVSGECWDKYRQHSNRSCMVAWEAGKWEPYRPNPAREAYLNWLTGYLSEQRAEGTELWEILQRELWPYKHPALYRPLGFAKKLSRVMKELVRTAAKRILPVSAYYQLRDRWRDQEYTPPPGEVRFGGLRRVRPISPEWGFVRGLPVDRYYIERFLSTRARDIRGRALEIEDAAYTRQFGGERVTRSDVLHVVEGNPNATIVGDLTGAEHIPSDAFDCFVFTQTLQLIYDMPAAIRTIHRILKPGGVLLATFPGITQVSHHTGYEGEENWSGYWLWGLTALSVERMFGEVFGESNVEVGAYGNVLAASAFLYGLAAEELPKKKLRYHDPDYEVVITLRAVKPEVAAP